MSQTTLLLLITAGIFVAVGAIAVLLLRRKVKEGAPEEPNYYGYVLMGTVWVPAGLAMMLVFYLLDMPFIVGLPLFALGCVYLILGLRHRERW